MLVDHLASPDFYPRRFDDDKKCHDGPVPPSLDSFHLAGRRGDFDLSGRSAVLPVV